MKINKNQAKPHSHQVTVVSVSHQPQQKNRMLFTCVEGEGCSDSWWSSKTRRNGPEHHNGKCSEVIFRKDKSISLSFWTYEPCTRKQQLPQTNRGKKASTFLPKSRVYAVTFKSKKSHSIYGTRTSCCSSSKVHILTMWLLFGLETLKFPTRIKKLETISWQNTRAAPWLKRLQPLSCLVSLSFGH